jgi:phosphinothricin acetyltransferase
VSIRHAEAGRDGVACASIYAPYVRDGAASFEQVPPNADEMGERIARVTATHPWLVVELEGRVVGFAYASPHRARAAYRWAADVAVYLASEVRGRGLGRALYEALLPSLRAQRLQVACAGITLPNEASVRLHESLGFEPVGVYRGIGWKAGAWRDVGWWQLRLQPAGEDPPAEPLPPAAPSPQASSSGPAAGSS